MDDWSTPGVTDRRWALVRNSRQSFLLGASWSHHPSFSRRTVHVYLGPFLLTYRKPVRRG